MDIQRLRYFVTLSQEMHFGRAAKSVNVTQPTLSQGIKKLEYELGAPLFERSPQKVRLTAAGKKLLPHAISVLDQLKKAIQEVKEDIEEPSGTIRVGTIPTICPYLMPEVLTSIKKAAPRLKIDVYEETTSILVDHLKAGGLSLGLLSLPISERGLSSLTLCSEPFYLAVAKNHRLASKKTVNIREILKERLLILGEGHCFGDQSIDFCKLQRHDPHISFQGSSLTSVLKLASSGEGITFVPKIAMDSTTTADVRCLSITPKQPTREIGVIWRLSAPLDKAKNLFIDTVEKTLRAKKLLT